MKKTITSLSIAIIGLFVPGAVMADGTTTVEKVCTTNQYGETTCSEKTKRTEKVHEPVDAAIGDVNITLVLGGMLAGAYLAYHASKRVGQI